MIPTLVLVVLVALGFLAIVLEFFVPGMVLGAVGGFFLLLAVVAGFIADPTTGILTLLVAIVAAGVAIVLGSKILQESPVTLKQTHGTDDGFVAGPGDLAALTGKTGTSVTVLRPAGLVEISGRKVDVVTEGEMIESGIPVQVLRVEGNRVVVRAIQKVTPN